MTNETNIGRAMQVPWLWKAVGQLRIGSWCFTALLFAAFSAPAEKKLIYDEERGIIAVDIDHSQTALGTPAAKQRSERSRTSAAREDIHIGRSKDPAQAYFSSGLEYFRNYDYENALKNFSYADSIEPKPEYALWYGKALRQMERFSKMIFVMNSILKMYPSSNIADDALFEIAFYAQTSNDYAAADSLYGRLAEQYPFGTSYSNNQPFHEIARQQRQAMREEMTAALEILGYSMGDLSARYAAFQKSRRLPVSGKGDSATVAAIKAAYQAHRAKKAKDAQWQAGLQRYALLGVIAAAAMAVVIALLLFTLASICSKARQLATLRQLIADLDVQKIRSG